ncbi:hypothetical protein E2493_11420 [Sphingomonas parva]|uniref:Alpha/beta hydrolase n=1 Tax=Sphingomonas parva TaxID=2555898 RepID=A0A4Y8ZSC1_9SPHN|nr:hypothetical protein [Sphingomonas parva]TFI58182.1 hypothetical protein E2493_11420 [Sphingomonas parva]
MRIGPADRPALLILAPLLEEMNRTRALLAATMRRLAERGWTCLLPDLPGTGESERPLERCTWDDWRKAVRAAAPSPLAGIVAIRGGCLLDDAVPSQGVWRFSPVDGAALVRDLDRAGRVSDGGAAGYTLSPALAGALADAVPAGHARLRTLRLSSDPGAADRKLDHAPLWRRAEPQNSYELVDLIASDIDEWMRVCGAS